MADLEIRREIEAIKERNRRVEADKAWETSWERKALVFVLTYIVVVIVFASLGMQKPLENAIVPALAFLLSTLSIPYFKEIWLRNVYKR